MLKRFMLKFKYKKGSQNAITTYIIHYMYINPYLWQIELKKILIDIHKFPFPSISDYFYIPIIFDHFNIHCPTEAMVVGTIFFPVRVEEQFFFQYGLECHGNFQVQVLISVVLNKNSKSWKWKILQSQGSNPQPHGSDLIALPTELERNCYLGY